MLLCLLSFADGGGDVVSVVVVVHTAAKVAPVAVAVAGVVSDDELSSGICTAVS